MHWAGALRGEAGPSQIGVQPRAISLVAESDAAHFLARKLVAALGEVASSLGSGGSSIAHALQ